MPFDGTEYTGDSILAIIDRVDQLICDDFHWGQGGNEERPLRRHHYGETVGRTHRHCPRTALTECGTLWRQNECPVDEYFQRAVREIDPTALDGRDCVPDYNNAPHRTFSDIKALIRKARELRLADIMETVTV